MTPIFAYIDPGTGSLIWQSVTAALIGCSFYFRRFLGRFRKKARSKRTDL
ncbi:MAG TPA: hypothetical protein VH601_06465 [Bryobacteraceae bacterium]